MTHQIRMEIDSCSKVNYAIQQNKRPIVSRIRVINEGTTALTDVDLTITSIPEELCLPFVQHIDMIPAQSAVEMTTIDLLLNSAYLAGLSERLTTALTFTLVKGEEEVCTQPKEVTVLPANYWNGGSEYPELLAAYVTPNHALISQINQKAKEILEHWTGDNAFTGYLTHDPEYVKKVAAAIFEAIRQQDISYTISPSGCEDWGQRIRLCHELLNEKQGNCIEMSVLYAGCLEQAGFHPVLVLVPGHCMCAVWLENKCYPNIIMDDKAQLAGKLDEGNRLMLLVECTLMNSGSTCSFDAAMSSAKQTLMKGFDYCVDIACARRHSVSPLPIRQSEDGSEFTIQDIADVSPYVAVDPDAFNDVDPDDGVPTVYSKKEQWERRLLNMTMNNALLNLRFNKAVLPICCDNMTDLADVLASGEEFAVVSNTSGDERYTDFESLDRYNADDEDDWRQRRLRVPLSDAEIQKRGKELARAAKDSLEEQGANTLFLTMGVVKWYEADKPKAPHYAPVVMIPVDIARTAAGYKVRVREEEAQLNVTLLENFKQNFKIELPAWDGVPLRDNGGVDVRKVLASLRRALQDQKGWEVLKGVSVANYSFTNFGLWKDIHEHPEVLDNNTVVAGLLAGHTLCDEQELSATDLDESAAMPVVTDASQLLAIQAANSGRSFVLNGPPGGGKSQTSTAMIATAIGEGKKVLLVTEKLAALTVVEQRLCEIGLDPFCLQLHSANTKKSEVLRHFDRLLELAQEAQSEEFAVKSREIQEVRDSLDQYAKALHAVGKSGMSLFELITKYETLDGEAVFSPDDLPEQGSLTAQVIAEQEKTLGVLGVMREVVGDPSGHVLRQISDTRYSQSFKQRLAAAVHAYKKSLEKLENSGRVLAEMLSLPVPSTHTEYASLFEVSGHVNGWHYPAVWAKQGMMESLTPIRTMAMEQHKLEQLRGQLLEWFDESILQADCEQLIGLYNNVANAHPVTRIVHETRLKQAIRPYAKKEIPPSMLGVCLSQLRHYQTCEASARDRLFENQVVLREQFGDGPYDWKEIYTSLEAAEHATVKITSVFNTAEGGDVLNAIGNDCGRVQSVQYAEAFEDACSKGQALYEMLCLEMPREGEDWVRAEWANCDSIYAQLDMLRDWVSWNRACKDAREVGLGCVVNALQNGDDPKATIDGYRKSVYQTLIADAVDSDPTLCEFNGAIFDEMIKELRRLDKELIELTKKEIRAKLIRRVGETVQAFNRDNTELTTLRKAIRSGGRGMSIRKLFAETRHLFLELCPCLLMSPVSVAQYLPMENGLFDIVVFDEASQLTTAKAVGALARGNSAVIVGDCNQMPPTSFFETTTVDEDNLETEDLESVLDDCLSIGLPSTYLKWHYRSRHESLIAFSNYRFYDNKLLTFPSANDRNSHVQLVYLQNGMFDRGKTRVNRAEAEAIVNYLKDHCRNEAKKQMSVGIVTFNIQQQRLVEDCVQEACRTDDELRVWCDTVKEQMFIKNLENVQGDERDIILFSIAYGPDSEGKVSMNFGPINKEGGWRRLNVAVSRSRDEMVVFSSLLPEQINLSGSNSRGVSELRAFLEYAGGRELPVNSSTVKTLTAPTGIADSVCECLERAGYETVRNVGCSDLRVDIAVVDPRNTDRYLMGILLDGASYAAAKTTRDRELSQVDVLSGLGWNIHRVWTLDWWDNREKERRRLIEKLSQLQSDCA